MSTPPVILLLSGSLRSGSGTVAAPEVRRGVGETLGLLMAVERA